MRKYTMPDKKNKLSLKIQPPTLPDQEKAKEAFIKEAGQKKESAETKKKIIYPWEAPEINERVIKSFNLRLAEPDFEKLKYVSEQAPDKSMHAFCARVVMDEVNKIVSKIN